MVLVSPSAVVCGVFVVQTVKSEVDKVKANRESVMTMNCTVKVSKANTQEMKIVCGSKTELVSLPKRFASMAGSVQLFCGVKVAAIEEVAAVAVNELV